MSHDWEDSLDKKLSRTEIDTILIVKNSNNK